MKNYFGASSSKDSINKQLAAYAGLFENASVEILDLNDYEMPIFSIDVEAATGVPTLATDFFNKLGTADLLVTFAEHNGAYSAAFKIFLTGFREFTLTFQEKTNLNGYFARSKRSSVLEIAKTVFLFKALTSKEASHYLVLMIILIQRME
jgi:hypothetical protein